MGTHEEAGASMVRRAFDMARRGGLVVGLLAGILPDARASDTEIGFERRFGLGIAAGFPSAATLKLQAAPRHGVSLHVGPTLATSGLHLRLQYDQSSARLKTWGFGELWVGWQLGAIVNLVFGEIVGTTAVRLGLTAGAALDLRLAPAPISAFVEAGPILFPIELAQPETSTFQPAGLVLCVGARWWF